MNITLLPELSREAIEFVLTHEFRFVATCKVDFPASIINDFEKALFFAESDEIEHSEFTFGDVKELAVAELRSILDTPENGFGAVNAIIRALDDLAPRLRRKLTPAFRDLADDIATDFTYIAVARAARVSHDNIFERMYKLYRCDFWPCGWIGPFPDGLLCAYTDEPA
jgi:hypothetical protein